MISVIDRRRKIPIGEEIEKKRKIEKTGYRSVFTPIYPN
jgi:hypothetical protein